MTTIEIRIAPDLILCHHFKHTGTARLDSTDNANEFKPSLEIKLMIQGTTAGCVYRCSLADFSYFESYHDILLPEALPC
jgi:hypothetical protein